MPFIVIVISFYYAVSNFNSAIFLGNVLNIRILYITVAKFPASLTNYLVAISSFTRLNNFITSESS
jgi:hypothetical protein